MFCSDFLHIYQLGEMNEDDIVDLNTDFLICIKSIVLWSNLPKIMTNLVSVQLLRNRWAEWDVVFRDGLIEDMM